jgi:hypothetical protein
MNCIPQQPRDETSQVVSLIPGGGKGNHSSLLRMQVGRCGSLQLGFHRYFWKTQLLIAAIAQRLVHK